MAMLIFHFANSKNECYLLFFVCIYQCFFRGYGLNRILKVAITVFPFWFSSPCHALYNGNPSAPELPESGCLIGKDFFLGIKAGYIGDLVFSRSMIVKASQSQADHEISSFKSLMNAGIITVDFMNRVDLYTAIGTYQIKLSQKIRENNRIHYTSDHHIGGMAGIKAVLACWGDTQIGVDVKGFLSCPRIEAIHVNDSHADVGHSKCSDRQWQIGAALSQRVGWFVPYIGATYTHAELKLKSLSSLQQYYPKKEVLLTNKYSFGFILGFGLAFDSMLSLNLEAKMIEETAGSCSLDFRF